MQTLIEILQAFLGLFTSNTQRPPIRNNANERRGEQSNEIYPGTYRSSQSAVSWNVPNDIRGSLIAAERTRMELQIDYTNRFGKPSSRVIEVHGVGREYIDAYDHRRNTFRTFRISRFENIPFQAHLVLENCEVSKIDTDQSLLRLAYAWTMPSNG